MEAAVIAQGGSLVVFGIHPTSPDTGFGYLEVEHVARDSQPVLRFVEKPDMETAQAYLATGRYYWNSGMFCFTAGAMLKAMAEHAPHVLEAAQAAFKAGQTTAGITRFDGHLFGLQPDISIDYAVMEKAHNVVAVPARFGWSDVGSWPAVAQAHTQDASGNTFIADVVAVETQRHPCAGGKPRPQGSGHGGRERPGGGRHAGCFARAQANPRRTRSSRWSTR